MKKNSKNTNIMDKMVAVILILSITAIICIVYWTFIDKKTVYASTSKEYANNNSNYEIIEDLPIDIEKIIDDNTKNVKREQIIKKEIDLEYITKYNNNPNLPKGMMQVIQEGTDGKQEIITKKTYEGDKLIKEEQVGAKTIKASINKIVEVGTGNYVSNYKAKVGDTLYVTSELLAVRIQTNTSAEKLITINKNSQVKLLKIKNEWYQICYQTYTGWAKSECLTYLNPNDNNKNAIRKDTYTKQQLINKLSFNMELNKPSGLSLEQFKKIFKNETKDSKKIFANNAEYFYYAEKQYNINGVFLAAVAIHESGWGGSSIASDKNNLFGYGAYDRDPYNSAYEFSNCSEGIDLLARVFSKYYLNKSGSKIYDGNIADGCYYNGATLTGVNKKYATDKNWANGVYYWMKYLYNNL